MSGSGRKKLSKQDVKTKEGRVAKIMHKATSISTAAKRAAAAALRSASNNPGKNDPFHLQTPTLRRMFWRSLGVMPTISAKRNSYVCRSAGTRYVGDLGSILRRAQLVAKHSGAKQYVTEDHINFALVSLGFRRAYGTCK
jgi:hypothetical protein